MNIFKKIFSKINDIFDRCWWNISNRVWQKITYRIEMKIKDEIEDRLEEAKDRFVPKDRFERIQSIVEDIKLKTMDRIKNPRVIAKTKRKKPIAKD